MKKSTNIPKTPCPICRLSKRITDLEVTAFNLYRLICHLEATIKAQQKRPTLRRVK